MGRHPEVSTRVATLLKTQKGKCTYCGLYFARKMYWRLTTLPGAKGEETITKPSDTT